MKAFCSVLLLCAVLVTSTPPTSAQGEERYSKRYDSLDVNTIFRSSRLLNNYVDCLLDKKACPPEGKELKRVLPHALRTRCSLCTNVQKYKALDVITRLYYEHPTIYTALAERYDPTGAYTKNFESWFDEQNAVKPRPPLPQDQPQVTDDEIISRLPVGIASDEPASTQTAIRRSPSDTGTFNSPNELPITERTRIPTSWVTKTTTTTTESPTSPRAPLRTTSQSPRRDPPRRDPPRRDPPRRDQPVTTSRPMTPSFQIENFFAPRPNGPITRSINKLLDTTEKVVNGFGAMFRTTFEIITGTG